MTTITNTALNSRNMSGVITISDGNGTIIENGNIETGDVISDSLTTNQINTTVLTVTGEFRCNLNGPLLIPTSISSLTGLLISYGNTTNSGATDFTNFGSTYTSTQQGFRFWNKSNTQTLTNLAIIDNTQTFFSSPLTGCLAESPVSANSVANRSYVDDNFCNLSTNQLVGGQKTFLGDMITQNITCTSALYFIDLANALSTNTPQIYMQADIFYFDTNPTYDNEWHFWCAGNPRLTISQYSTEIKTPLILYEYLTSTKQATFDNFTPICSVASPTANNHLTRKDYIDNNFMNLTTGQTKSGSVNFLNQITFNGGSGGGTAIVCNNGLNANTFLNVAGQATFNNLTPICSVASPTANNHLSRKDYIDNNFLDRTNNLTQNINGLKTFTNNTTFNGEATFNNLVHLKSTTRMYDLITPFTNYTSFYTTGNASVIYAGFAGSSIQFYCRTAGNLDVQTFYSFATANTSVVPFVASSTATFNSSLISDNLTSPTTTTTNNIYTTLVSGGVINMGGLLGSNNIAGLTTLSEATTFNATAKFKTGIEIYNGVNVSIIKQATNFLNIKNLFQGGSISLETTAVVGGAADRLIISHTSCDILPDTLNLTSSSTINILTPNNLTGVINFLSTLTTATINFCSTTFTSVFFLNARLAHKQVQYMNEVKIISGTSLTLVFPLEQRWQFTSTGATQIVIDLPQLTATSQTGFNFSFYKTASNTNSVKFNRQGTNVIRSLNSITDLTTITVISGTGTTGGFLTAELSAGNFAWIYY